MIDYRDAWVVIEISTRKLTRATTIALEPEALADELRMARKRSSSSTRRSVS